MKGNVLPTPRFTPVKKLSAGAASPYTNISPTALPTDGASDTLSFSTKVESARSKTQVTWGLASKARDGYRPTDEIASFSLVLVVPAGLFFSELWLRTSNHTMQELFTSLMAKESFSVAQSQNRRLLKLQDITDIMHNQVCVRARTGMR